MPTTKRRMFAATISHAATALDESARKERRRVLDWVRGRRNDPVAQAAHSALKAGHPDVDIVVAMSRAARNTYVEQVALLQPLESVKACVEIPSLPANDERAVLAGRLLNAQSASRALVRGGAQFRGLFVAFFETGYSSLDAAIRAVMERLKDEGFRVGEASASVRGEIEERAAALVPARHSWRPDMRVAFAAPELVLELAAEQLRIEQWLRELAAEDEGDELAFWTRVVEGIADMRANAARSALVLYSALLDEVTRRIRSVDARIGLDGLSCGIELRHPDNDNSDCNAPRSKDR